MVLGFFVSRVVLSLSMMLFGINALRDVHPRYWIKDRWWILGVLWVAMFGFSYFWSEGKDFWYDRFQVKFAILLLPLAFSFTPRFTPRQLQVFTVFLHAVLMAACGYTISFLVRDAAFYIKGYDVSHVLPVIPKGDHIRFSLAIAAGIIWGVYAYPLLPGKGARIFTAASCLLLSIFLHVLAARTGLVAWYVFIAGWCVYLVLHRKTRVIGASLILFFIIAGIMAFTYIPTLRQRLGYFKYTLIVYKQGEMSGEYSDMGRLMSYDIAWRLIKQDPVLGVGAGDILQSMKKGYDQWYPQVKEEQRLVPHNQFLVVALGCGIPTLVLFIAWIFYPLFQIKRNRAGFFFLISWTILFLSLLVEPMLEVQFGVFVYLFFLLWQRLFNAPAQQTDYQTLKLDAERAYAQGSYSRAKEIYSRVDQKSLPPADLRWVQFRLADTAWRAQAGTATADNTTFELAESTLATLIRTHDKEDERDLVWAEAHESLGDFYWTRRSQMNWGGAWPHYQQALDWWAGQREIEPARERYLKIVFRAANPPLSRIEYYYYAYYGNYIPLDILENALKISTSENEKSQLHFLIAMTMRNTGGDWESRQRVADEFEEALKAGKQSDWYDDALFYYAEWMNSNGTIVQLEDGQWQQQPDYVKALELYRRLMREFDKGETRYYDQAQQHIKNITEPPSASASRTFSSRIPKLQFVLNARNVKRVDFALYKIDLTRDVRFTSHFEEDEGES